MFLKVNVKNTLNYKKKCIDNNDIFLLLAVKLSRKNYSRHNYNNIYHQVGAKLRV